MQCNALNFKYFYQQDMSANKLFQTTTK